MAIKVGSLDLNQYAVQTRQALEAYKTGRVETQPLPESRGNEPRPVSSNELSSLLSNDERQALADAFGGPMTQDSGFLRRTPALILKGSRIDLTV
jgi:hypothetical protein